jgi:hypothetical protein
VVTGREMQVTAIEIEFAQPGPVRPDRPAEACDGATFATRPAE